LPYWLHKQTNGNIHSVSPQNPLVPDAVSGATPKGSFTIETAVSKQLPNKFRVLLEINQAWDWNEYYTNAKYPEILNINLMSTFSNICSNYRFTITN
jgi:hypothetical protein